MRRHLSGFVSLILLTGFLFCTMDGLHTHVPEAQNQSYVVARLLSNASIMPHSHGHQHDEEVCREKLRADKPRYLTFRQYQQSYLQPEMFHNNESLVFQISTVVQATSRLYYYKIPDGIRRQFTTEHVIANPSTGPPA